MVQIISRFYRVHTQHNENGLVVKDKANDFEEAIQVIENILFCEEHSNIKSITIKA